MAVLCALLALAGAVACWYGSWRADADGTGPRGLRADIEHVRALLKGAFGAPNGLRQITMQAVARKGVGGEVDDGHHLWARKIETKTPTLEDRHTGSRLKTGRINRPARLMNQ